MLRLAPRNINMGDMAKKVERARQISSVLSHNKAQSSVILLTIACEPMRRSSQGRAK